MEDENIYAADQALEQASKARGREGQTAQLLFLESIAHSLLAIAEHLYNQQCADHACAPAAQPAHGNTEGVRAHENEGTHSAPRGCTPLKPQTL